MTDLSLHPWKSDLDWRNAQGTTRGGRWCDIVGEPAHLIAAIFALIMEPISTATASIGFATLCVVAALRLPVLWPIWRRMFEQTWIKLLVLWIVWTAISIAWSPDRHVGVDRLSHIKFFAWLPLLWPLHRYWKWLFGGFLFSTMVLQGIQISGEFFGATYKDASIASGMRHPTMAGMWNAIALSCWLFLSVSAGWRVLCLSIPMATLSAFGFFWAGQRAALVGILIEIALANIILGIVAKGWIRKAITRGAIGILILGVVYFVAGARMTAKLEQVSKETKQSLQGDAPEIVECRIAMWKMSLIAWEKSPIFGVGLGGYRKSTAEIDVGYKRENIYKYDTSHSTYIMILTESGIVGLALFLVWGVAFFVRAIVCLRADPVRIGAFGGTIIWFSAAAFDSFHTRGVFLTVGVIMIALAVMPRTTRSTTSLT